MNNDTIGEYDDALASHYTDWHTAYYSAMWHVFIGAGLRSPGWALAAATLILLAGLYLLLRARLSRPWALAGAAAVFAFPPVLGFAVVIGTDAWFAASLLCAFGLVIRAARTEGWSRAVSAVLAVVLAFLAQAARPTALPAVALVLAGLALVTVSERLGGWRRLLAAGAIGVAAGGVLYGSNVALDRLVLHAQQSHPEQATYKYDLVGLSIREHRVLLPSAIYPRQDLAFLAAHSNASTVVFVDPLMWGAYASIPPLVEGAQFDSLQRAWLSAILGDPAEYLRFRAHTALYQLTIRGDPQTVYYAAPIPYGYPPPFPAVHAAAQAYTGIGSTPDATGGPLQRVWVYVLALVAVVVLCLRAGRRVDVVLALLGGALLLYTAEILLVGPIVTYRYMYPTVATATVLVLVLAGGAIRRRLVRSA